METVTLESPPDAAPFASAVAASGEADASRVELLREYEQMLETAMTDEDVIATSDEAAAISQEITDAEMELENESERHKDKKKRFESIIGERRRALAQRMHMVKCRSQPKLVACRDDKVFETGCVRSVRLDTGEVIDERPMNHRERQAGLFASDPDSGDQRLDDPRDLDAPESFSALADESEPPPVEPLESKDEAGSFADAATIDDPETVLGDLEPEPEPKKRRGRR